MAINIGSVHSKTEELCTSIDWIVRLSLVTTVPPITTLYSQYYFKKMLIGCVVPYQKLSRNTVMILLFLSQTIKIQPEKNTNVIRDGIPPSTPVTYRKSTMIDGSAKPASFFSHECIHIILIFFRIPHPLASVLRIKTVEMGFRSRLLQLQVGAYHVINKTVTKNAIGTLQRDLVDLCNFWYFSL